MAQSKESNWERTQEQINEYLAGRMDDAARESFELRIFEEPELSTEVERAAELRVAFRDTVGAPSSRRTQWMPLAAAAAVAALAIGIWVNVPQIETPPVDTGSTPRGQTTPLAVEVAPVDGAFMVSWSTIPEATNYELRVHLEDGSVVYDRELPGDTARHRFVLDDQVTGRTLLRVRALDSFRDIRADSGLIPIPED